MTRFLQVIRSSGRDRQTEMNALYIVSGDDDFKRNGCVDGFMNRTILGHWGRLGTESCIFLLPTPATTFSRVLKSFCTRLWNPILQAKGPKSKRPVGMRPILLYVSPAPDFNLAFQICRTILGMKLWSWSRVCAQCKRALKTWKQQRWKRWLRAVVGVTLYGHETMNQALWGMWFLHSAARSPQER